jgi:hypothetical protein
LRIFLSDPEISCLFNGKEMKKIIISLSSSVVLLSGCGQECYTTPLQVKAKYERCADLGTSFSGRIGKPVWSFACTTSGNDVSADFIVKDGKYCRTSQLN